MIRQFLVVFGLGLVAVQAQTSGTVSAPKGTTSIATVKSLIERRINRWNQLHTSKCANTGENVPADPKLVCGPSCGDLAMGIQQLQGALNFLQSREFAPCLTSRTGRCKDQWQQIETVSAELRSASDELVDQPEVCAKIKAQPLKAEKNGKIGFVDRYQNAVIPYQFDAVGMTWSEGLMAVCKGVGCTDVVGGVSGGSGGKWGFVNGSGSIVIPLQFDGVSGFFGGLASFCVGAKCSQYGGKYGFIDKSGKVVVSAAYDGVQQFSEGLVSVCQGGSCGPQEYGPSRYGYLDSAGSVAIPLRFHFAGEFEGGIAPVCMDPAGRSKSCFDSRSTARWGYIDRTGKVVVPLRYNAASGGRVCAGKTCGAGMTDAKWYKVDPASNYALVPDETTAPVRR